MRAETVGAAPSTDEVVARQTEGPRQPSLFSQAPRPTALQPAELEAPRPPSKEPPQPAPTAIATPPRQSAAPRPAIFLRQSSEAWSTPPPPPPITSPPQGLLAELSGQAVPITFGEAPRGAGGHLELPEALRLEHNLALLAGAGAGKTHTLITLCLHLLSGARSHGVPIRPARLALVTFTEVAAAEMRDRLRLRVEALARGELDEPELLGTFEELGRAPPDRNFWRAVRDELGSASISTFHSLCIQLLRRAPEGSGVNPAFGLLEDRDARALLNDVVERELLEALSDTTNAPLREATQELGLGRLVEGLVDVLTRIREEGVDPQTIPITHRPAALAAFEEARRGVLQALDAALGYDKNRAVQTVARTLAPLLRSITVDTFLPRFAEVNQALKAERGQPIDVLKRRLRPPEKGAADAAPTLLEAWTSLHLCDAEAALRTLLGRLREVHAQALEARGVLDFTAQLSRARDLLRDHPEARREAQAQFDALLVDEFQDTNRLQLELALLLAEQRANGPRPLTGVLTGGASDEVLSLPLQRGFLCVVGDRKQSIYEFRGADVSVFEQMANRVEASGGGRAFLKTSRRSSPRLVEFFNALFPHVLAPPSEGTPRPFEIVYQPAEDDLIAHRTDDDGARAVARLTSSLTEQASADQLRVLDAQAVARAVAQLVHGGATVFDRQTQARRPLRGSDVVLLFRTFSHIEWYRAALVKAQVRHRLVGGRGFYGASEVRDLASLLALVADPADTLSCAAVLRSPLVALSDASLVRLLVPGRGLDSLALLEGALPVQALPAEERARLERFLALWPRLRKERDRLGVRALLEVAIDALELRAAFAAAPFGEQSLANLEKLLLLVGQRDARGLGFAAVARELLLLAEEAPKEEQAEAVDALDVDAVTLMTVHRAKGLEWPVVVLPELFARGQSQTLAVRFDRDVGLLLSPWTLEGVQLKSLRGREGRDEHTRRSDAELQRLLYVAATRARDRVVLGLWGDKGVSGTFAGLLSGPLTGNAILAAEACERVDFESLPQRTQAAPAAPAAADGARLEAALARVRGAPPPRARSVMLPVTALQDFVACPRRYRFAHLVGLAERPRALTWELDVPDAAVDARSRGADAHRLLELAPLALAGTDRFVPALQALARREGLTLEPEVFDWVAGFWSTPFGRAAAAAPGRLHRELPFVLTLGEGDFALHLRGQIDLLVEGEGGGATVVDYKAARRPPQGLAAYRFQLGCYALAARHFLGDGEGLVRAGISFLRDADRAPQLLSAQDTAAAVEGQALVRAANALAQAQVSGAFEGRALATCEALGCGYRYRCHPSEPPAPE